MRKNLLFVTLLNILFLLFFIFGEALSSPISGVLHYLAFIVPIFLGLLFLGSTTKERGLKFGIDKAGLLMSLPFILPTVGAVFLISAVTSLLFSLFGLSDTPPDLSGNIMTVLLVNAVLPAVLEEFLFRYIPINLLSDGSRKVAVLFSAGMFALVHCNIFQLPYAFIAGVIFALLDVAFGSVLPSIMIHLVNNAVSVFWLRFGTDGAAAFVAALFAVSVSSLVPIFIMRKKYKIFFTERYNGAG